MTTRAVKILLSGKETASEPISRVKKAAGGLTSSLGGLKGAVIAAGSALAAYFSAQFFKSSLEAFGRQEEAQRGLAKTLQLNGDNVDELMPKYQAFASEIQRITTVGDEATLEIMQQGRMLGIQADQLEEATKAAIGLSEASGGRLGLEQAMQQVARAREGDLSGLNKYIPALKTATDETEKAAIVNKFMGDGFALAQDKTGTFNGAIQKVRNTIGELMERIGEGLAPTIHRMVAMFQNAAPTFDWVIKSIGDGFNWLMNFTQPIFNAIGESVMVLVETAKINFATLMDIVGSFGLKFDWAGGMVESISEGIVAVTKWVAEMGIRQWTALEVAIGNWRKMLEIAFTAAKLGAVSYVEQVKHNFTVVIPDYLAWFGRNWANIFKDIFNFTITVLRNMQENLTNFFGLVIASLQGQSYSFEWTGLTDGFKATMEKLPAIFDRELSATERALMGRIAELGQEVGNEFNTKLAERLGRLDAALVGRPAGPQATGDAGGFGGLQFAPNAAEAVKQIVKENFGKVGGSGGEKGGVNVLQAQSSRFLTRGSAQQTGELRLLAEAQKQARAAEENNVMQGKVVVLLEKLNGKMSVPAVVRIA